MNCYLCEPSGFLDDLPRYYTPLENVIKDYLYLADNELSEKCINFIEWVNLAKVDGKRFDKIVTSGLK